MVGSRNERALTHRAEMSRTLRASVGSYIAFCGIWVLLAGAYGHLALRRPGAGLEIGAAIAGLAAGVSILWMSGHRIWVAAGVLHYRDGFFRSRSIPLAEIESIAAGWEGINLLGREIRIPRLRVVARTELQSFQINPKPFSRRSLGQLFDLVRDSDTSPALPRKRGVAAKSRRRDP